MARTSAGLLLYRRSAGVLEVLLVHPGGPLWAKRDDGAWSIPKGEIDADEDALAAAKRELEEELGVAAIGAPIRLAPVRQAGGKVVHAWALEQDVDVTRLRSNTFTMEWPPKSGRRQTFPEVDRAAWFTLSAAKRKILKGQLGLLAELPAVAERTRD
jgi:predicted NUDIX family NTP pyrophosphohydrolase